jgi:hypothetical protein
MQSGFERGAPLAHQNAPGAHELSAEALDAQTLADAVTAISRAPTCFLMRHSASSATLLGWLDCRACHNLSDAQKRLPLTVPLLFLVTFATLMLKNDELRTSHLPHDRPHDAGLLKLWLPDGGLVPFAHHEHGVELNSIPGSARKFFDRDEVAL